MTLLERIKKHEGFRGHAYLDSKGFLSIGYGTTVGRIYCEGKPIDMTKERHQAWMSGLSFEPEGVGITEDEAAGMAYRRLTEIISALWSSRLTVYGQMKKSVNSARADVLAEMAYQMGVGGLLGFKRMLRFLAEGKYLAASREVVWRDGSDESKGRSKLYLDTPERAEYYERVLREGVA